MSPTPPTFYVLHGEDEFSRKAELRNMRARMGDAGTAELNTATFEGKTATAAEVIAAVCAMPFLSDKRLVIVEGMLSWLTRKGGGKSAKAELDVLINGLPGLPDSARLVFVESDTLNEHHPILKLVQQEPRGYAKAFNPPRDTSRWIIKQVETYGGKIDPQAVAALSAVVGTDLRAADGECLKLVTYAGGERPITEADVTLLTRYVPEARIFDMVDAVAERNGRLATILMHRLLDDQEPLALLGMINRQFRLLIQAREVMDAGGGSGDLLKLPDIKHPFVAQKLTQQARNFNIEQLEGIYRHLLETDQAIKTGRVEPELALDLFVAGLAA